MRRAGLATGDLLSPVLWHTGLRLIANSPWRGRPTRGGLGGFGWSAAWRPKIRVSVQLHLPPFKPVCCLARGRGEAPQCAADRASEDMRLEAPSCCGAPLNSGPWAGHHRPTPAGWSLQMRCVPAAAAGPRQMLAFPARLARTRAAALRTHGSGALRQRPRVIVGTRMEEEG